MENKDVSQTELCETTERDPLFEEVARTVVSSGNATAARIAFDYCIGSNRASRIVEQLEVAGIVGPSLGGKQRKVLVDLPTLKAKLNKNKNTRPVQTNPFNPDYFSYTVNYPIEEVWNTDNVLAQLIVPRLSAFKELDKHGCPEDFKDMRAWNNAIQEMVDAFELMKYVQSLSDEESAIVEKGLNLFCKYFRNLWD